MTHTPKIFNTHLLSEMPIALPLWLSCLCDYFWQIVAHNLFGISLHCLNDHYIKDG